MKPMLPVLVVLLALLFPGVALAQDSAGADRRIEGEELQSLQSLLDKGEIFFLDVREPWELEKFGTLRGHVNIPLGQLEQRLNEVPKDKAIVTA